MANINKIRLSGQTYNIEDSNAPKTVELTQAQYDALAVKDPNTFYIITDAQGADLSQYYTSAQTESAITQAVSGKQDTLVSGTNIKTINNESLLGSGNINIQGGGKAIEAGRGISITTGETADTVSFNLPISAGTGTNSIVMGEKATANGAWSFANGNGNILYGTSAAGERAIAIGFVCEANGNTSIANGQYCYANGIFSHAIGGYVNASNDYETSIGKTNVSNKANDTFGNSGNTLFSIGNGDLSSKRHNALEIRQNGDIYIADTNDTSTTNWYQKPMIKLQDQLGGGGSSYTAGDGIDITNDVISVTGKTDTSAFTAHTADTTIHVTTAQTAAWNAKSDFSGSYNDLTDKPTIPTVPTSNTAFTNDAGYITSDAISGKADTSAVTESINAAVSGKVDTSTFNTYSGSVDTALSGKQDTLSAGTGIDITDNVISATGGGGSSYTAGDGIDITNDVISVSGVSHNSLADGTKMLLKGDVTSVGQNYSTIGFDYYYGTSSNKSSITIKPLTINGYSALRTQALSISVVETSAITTSVTSSSTDAQVPSAKCVYDQLGGLKLVKLTQSAYDALSPDYDSNTLYIIKD